MMDDCIFCKIARGEIPSRKVYEDDHVVAFWDLAPVAPIHILIVPKAHYPNLYEMTGHPEGLLALDRLHRALPEVIRASGLSDKGFRLINNCGENAGQTVMHVHYHLIGGMELGPRII